MLEKVTLKEIIYKQQKKCWLMKTDTERYEEYLELHIDDLDGVVTLFKSTDEGTETIAVFDEEHREVIQDLLEHVKGLTKTLELIGKNMEYDPWMHTLIKDVIGYEKLTQGRYKYIHQLW